MRDDISMLLELADYRAAVAGLYAEVTHTSHPEATWETWRQERAALLATHPQSPFSGRPGSTRPEFHPYDPTWRVLGRVIPETDGPPLHVEQADGSAEHFDPIGSVEFVRSEQRHALPLYWLRGYSGGLFLPFADATNGDTTYGSGRYLLDQAKSAFLGFEDGRLVLDFNFAYHPSCVWGDWICPLPHAESRLDVRVEAGERATPA